MKNVWSFHVHGDIRHLESGGAIAAAADGVHGDIRHLEIQTVSIHHRHRVHGDIRHLEKERFH